MTVIDEHAQTEVAPAGSLMEQLRAKRSQIAARTTLDLAVAGYNDPQLVCRYRLIGDADQIKPIGKRVRQQFTDDVDRELYMAVDIMIEACEGFYVRHAGTDELIPLDPEGDGPLRYEQRLAEFLGFPSEDARTVVRGVFCDNDNAIVNHGRRLQLWMGDTSLRVDEEFLGEA